MWAKTVVRKRTASPRVRLGRRPWREGNKHGPHYCFGLHLAHSRDWRGT